MIYHQQQIIDLEAIRNELVSLCSIKAGLEIGTSSKINMGYVPPIATRFPEDRGTQSDETWNNFHGAWKPSWYQVAASSDNRKQAKGRRALSTIWRIETLPASTLDKRLDSGSSSQSLASISHPFPLFSLSLFIFLSLLDDPYAALQMDRVISRRSWSRDARLADYRADASRFVSRQLLPYFVGDRTRLTVPDACNFTPLRAHLGFSRIPPGFRGDLCPFCPADRDASRRFDLLSRQILEKSRWFLSSPPSSKVS